MASRDARCQLQTEPKKLEIKLVSRRIKCDGNLQRDSPLLEADARCQSRSVMTLLGRDAGGPGTAGGAQGTFDTSESVPVIWRLKHAVLDNRFCVPACNAVSG